MDSAKKLAVSFDTRKASAEDTEFLHRLYCTTREEEVNAFNFSPEQRESFLRMQFDAQQAHYEKFYPNAEHRIIVIGEKKLGRELVDRSADEILLIDLALLPEFCGFGIGTNLLLRLREESAEGGKPLRLYAIKFNNRALRLYERLGFDAIDDTGVYLLLEWKPNRKSAR